MPEQLVLKSVASVPLRISLSGPGRLFLSQMRTASARGTSPQAGRELLLMRAIHRPSSQELVHGIAPFEQRSKPGSYPGASNSKVTPGNC